jgi:hypothetical protein
MLFTGHIDDSGRNVTLAGSAQVGSPAGMLLHLFSFTSASGFISTPPRQIPRPWLTESTHAGDTRPDPRAAPAIQHHCHGPRAAFRHRSGGETRDGKVPATPFHVHSFPALSTPLPLRSAPTRTNARRSRVTARCTTPSTSGPWRARTGARSSRSRTGSATSRA